MTSLDDLRGKFVAREKVVTIVAGGDLLAEHEALSQQLATAMAQTRTSLADGTAVGDLARQVADLEAQIAASTVTLRLRGLGRNAFRRLLAAHESDDQPFDRDTFPPALISACSLDPVLSESDVAELGNLLTDGQWDALFEAAWDACREVDGVPFSGLASAAIRD